MPTRLFQQVALFIFSISLIGYGILGIRRKRFEFGLGRPPIGTVVLTGLPALLASAACILGCLIAILTIAYRFLSADTIITEATLGAITLAGLLIAAGGVAFASVIQLAIYLGESIGKDSNDKDKNI
jgi:hypothetical protein